MRKLCYYLSWMDCIIFVVSVDVRNLSLISRGMIQGGDRVSKTPCGRFDSYSLRQVFKNQAVKEIVLVIEIGYQIN